MHGQLKGVADALELVYPRPYKYHMGHDMRELLHNSCKCKQYSMPAAGLLVDYVSTACSHGLMC